MDTLFASREIKGLMRDLTICKDFGRRIPVLALTVCLLPGRAWAECLGGGCYDGLVQLAVLVLIGILGVFALILYFLPRRLRRIVFWTTVSAVIASIAVPMVSEALMRRHLRAMAASEIVGHPPVLASRTPLIIGEPDVCQDTTCTAALYGMGTAGAYGLRLEVLMALDPGAPIVLADLPLEHWTLDRNVDAPPRTRVLDAAEREAAVAEIDYVIYTRSYYLTGTGPIDAALRDSLGVAGLGTDVTVRLFMAELPGKDGILSLKDLSFDLLDLWSLRQSYDMPLFLGGMSDAVNALAGQDSVEEALCGQSAEAWGCRAWISY